MKMQVFAIYDAKANYFRNPIAMLAKGEAIRAFTDIARDESTEIGKHPEDFSLFHLGDFDTDKGSFNNLTAPENIAFALEMKKSEGQLEISK